MEVSLRGNNGLLSRLKSLIKLQRFNHAFAEGGVKAQFYSEMVPDSVASKDISHIDTSKWRKINARKFGINGRMISSPSWTVLKVLRDKGFEAFLVGGCVRDLILKKVPKDFDVITSAGLKQIRKQFRRAHIVGQRFPICRVLIKDSVIEVSSFETVAKEKHSEAKDMVSFSQMPGGCDKMDFIRWKNSMQRDFTVNSLFFDPFLNIIYDYAEGMADLRSLKLQTLIPAPLSFKEDCARILRGLRIAARLGLSLSKDTEKAMHNLSSSIKSLAKSRIMMELNYMMSYGAAEPSLCLLQRFKLLEILLPFHAAYLEEQAFNKCPQSSVMLMKLFFNLDKLVSCDRPSDCNLWVGLLAFHLALINNPQDACVVLAFAAVLYHGEWEQSVKLARESAKLKVNFLPEISGSSQFITDEELAKGVSEFGSLVQDSIATLAETDFPFESIFTFPGLEFVSKKTAKDVAKIFEVLVNDIESYKATRESFEIDYLMLGKGSICETRFVMGKVILETMSDGVVQDGRQILIEEKNNLCLNNNEDNCNMTLSGLVKKDRKRGMPPDASEMKQSKKQKKCILPDQERAAKKHKMVEKGRCSEVAEKYRNVETCNSPDVERTEKQDALGSKRIQVKAKMHLEVEKEKHRASQDKVIKKQLYVAKCSVNETEVLDKENGFDRKDNISLQQVPIGSNGKTKQAAVGRKVKPPLSSLFK